MNDHLHTNADRFAREAEHCIELGAWQAAGEFAQKAMSLDRADARGRHAYGRVMIKLGHVGRGLKIARCFKDEQLVADALSLYGYLIEACDDANIYCEAAELMLQVGDESGAKRTLIGALEADSDHVLASQMMAKLLMGTGEFEESLRWWTKLWRVDSDDAQAAAGVLVCAVCLERRGLVTRMTEHLRLLLPLDRRQLLMGRTWVSALKGRVRRQALHLDHEASGRDSLSVMLAEAARDFEDQLESHPDYADLHYHVAICQQAIGETQSSAAHFDKALAINPGYVDALRQRVTGLLERQNVMAAQRLLQAAYQREHFANSVLDLALVVMIVTGSPEQALRYMGEKTLNQAANEEMAKHVFELLEKFKQDEHAEIWGMTCYQRLEVRVGEVERGERQAA